MYGESSGSHARLTLALTHHSGVTMELEAISTVISAWPGKMAHIRDTAHAHAWRQVGCNGTTRCLLGDLLASVTAEGCACATQLPLNRRVCS
jgi:hypothetical protein